MARTGRVGLVLAALAMAALGAAAAGGATYTAPFEDGPSGGGSGTYTNLQGDGTVTVARVYPVPGPLNCPAGGPYAKFEVHHEVTEPVGAVTATFSDAILDPYVFIKLTVRAADGTWLGIDERRGPLLLESGTLRTTLDPALFAGKKPRLRPGDVLTVQFGLESASACPHVNAGTARFTAVTVERGSEP